jgi:hypothetical protein
MQSTHSFFFFFWMFIAPFLFSLILFFLDISTIFIDCAKDKLALITAYNYHSIKLGLQITVIFFIGQREFYVYSQQKMNKFFWLHIVQ